MSRMIDDQAAQVVGHLLRRCYQLHDQIFARQTAGYDITSPQLAALVSIGAHPHIEQSTLAELIAYDTATIVGLVDRLEGKGLVVRSVGRSDRRRRELTLTTAGHELLKKVKPRADRVHDILLEMLNDEERSALMSTLRRIVRIDDEERTTGEVA